MVASKPASTRARRNKTSTRAILRAEPDIVVPGLPSHTEWHEAVEMWWADIWSSPMAPEWCDADVHALFLAAKLMQQVWADGTSAASRVTSATEVRHLLRECGLTPLARRSLQWEIERADEAQDRGEQRRAAKTTRPKSSRPDPRVGMHAVS